MTKWQGVCSLILVLLAPLAASTEAADSQIKGALMDIEKFERQFLQASHVNSSSVKRSLKLLSLTRQRLDSSPNKSHASWQQADTRYKALVAHMNQLLSPSGNSVSAPAQNTQATSAPASRAPARTRTSSGGAPQQMISQYRVRIKKIARDINSQIDTLDKAGVKPFQDKAYIEKYQGIVESFRASIAKYDDFKTDPDVVAASNALASMENMLRFGQDHAAKELAELGDVQARLRQINQNIRKLKQPATPTYPYKSGQLKVWLVELAAVRQQAQQLYEPLPQIKQRAHLPNNRYTVEQGAPYDFNDVVRLEQSLIGLVNAIDTELNTFGTNLNLQVQHIDEGLAFYDTFDPNDASHHAKHFLTAGRSEEIRAKFAQDKEIASEATQYAKLINDPSYNQRAALVERISAAQKKYEANYNKARSLARMPKAASKDSKLLNIAKKTLANYDSVGDYKRIVINADKVHRTKETSETQYDDVDVSLSGDITLTGTKTTYFYEWDQFQVATAEQEGGRYYIYYNTLKYFTSGASTTPLNKWILSGRIQGIEIPQENIHKN